MKIRLQLPSLDLKNLINEGVLIRLGEGGKVGGGGTVRGVYLSPKSSWKSIVLNTLFVC